MDGAQAGRGCLEAGRGEGGEDYLKGLWRKGAESQSQNKARGLDL